MNVVQSYYTTIMRGDFTLYEVRIFLKIVELANTLVAGSKYSELKGKAVSADGINANLSIPCRELLTEGSNAYDRIKAALNRLMSKKVELKDPKTGEYKAATLLNNIRMSQHDGFVHFVVPTWLLEYIVNFTNGRFSIYDLQHALALPSAYSVRIYWLVASMKNPINFPVDMLKEMLGATQKYPKTKDFIKRCIEPAREDLEEAKLNGFSYEKVFVGRKIVYLKFLPIKRQVEKPNQVMAGYPATIFMRPTIRLYLASQANFSINTFNKNKQTMADFCNIPDCEEKIYHIVGRARRKRMGVGYIISAMRDEVEKFKKGTE